ncbi:MAG TPA: plastocyanin/azurin family copper-binding protein [Gemmatimonadaceae bacterium]|nr:plastocyanin/azurin family copper-binding protein [Gemmatimonadaceae bacterium]
MTRYYTGLIAAAAAAGLFAGAGCTSTGDDAAASAKAASAAGASTSTTTPAAPTTTAAAPANSTSTAAGDVAPAITGKTVSVQMVGDAKGYRFEPATITLKAGDGVKWVNATGGPHNVTFWSDSIPSGAAAVLGKAMPGTTSPLSGPLLVTPNQTYIVSFAGAPAGTYHYYCTPHLALGMIAKITVQ